MTTINVPKGLRRVRWKMDLRTGPTLRPWTFPRRGPARGAVPAGDRRRTCACAGGAELRWILDLGAGVCGWCAELLGAAPAV